MIVSNLHVQYEIHVSDSFNLLPITDKMLEFVGSFVSHYALPTHSVFKMDDYIYYDFGVLVNHLADPDH